MKHHIMLTNTKVQRRITANYPMMSRPRRERTLPPIQDLNSTVVLSMDVSALYPSISQELTVRTLTKAIKESNVPWYNIDSERLVRYVSLIVKEKVLKDNKIDKCVPVPMRTTTLNSYTNPSKKAKQNNCNDLFHERQEVPTSKQARTILAVAVSECARVCMDRHYYTFGGCIRKQNEGGSIGTEFTGEVSRNVMSQWDKKYLDLLKLLGVTVDMYKRYVDDTLQVVPPINRGWDFCTKSKIMFHI